MKSIAGIREELLGLSNPLAAEHAMRFFKTGKGEYGEGDRFLGIRVPVLRKIARKYRTLTPEEAIKLLQSPLHEQRLLALFILVERFNTSDEEGKEKIYHLYMANTRWINNWDLVDGSAPYIAGPYLFQKDKGPLYRLSLSANLWERRIAILSTFYFIRQNEFTDALHIARNLVNDREDLIHKAVGWMLREIGKRDPAAEIVFLDRHYTRMPRTMLRYAIEKFPAALRFQYMKVNRPDAN